KWAFGKCGGERRGGEAMMRPQPLGQLLRWVAGLGNHTFPGTRHSVGMAVLNHLASKLDVADQWKRDKRCCADMVVARLGEAELLLMKPRKFMNLNGISLASAVEKYNLSIEDIYLVHDDLDKPLGKISLKLGGSARLGKKMKIFHSGEKRRVLCRRFITQTCYQNIN
uniref:Peptidyl-tRNA hydrolase 1 homolog n=1 Tax=Pseudonaja textilis TaxID=8673 RepID=A0A670YF02_PSETE